MSDFGLFSDDEPVEEIPATLEDDRPGSGSPAFFNIVSILFFVLAVVVVLGAVGIYLNPNARYNIFGPGGDAPLPTPFTIPSLPPTQEIVTLPASWTPSPSPTDASGVIPTPPSTVPAVTIGPPTAAGPTTAAGSATATLFPTQSSGQSTLSAFPFTLQEGVPAFTENPEENGSCEALYIVGQVFDLAGQPVDGLAVWVTGDNFETPDITKFNDAYGPGSYSILVNSTPIEAEFEVQLWTVSAQSLSDKAVIRTRATCEENLIFVNFVQNHEY